MRTRVFWLTIWSFTAMAVLVGRLFVQMLFPDSINRLHVARWQEHVSAMADLEHLQLIQTDDGRGRVLYRNGAPWSGRVSRLVVDGAHAKAVHFIHTESVDAPMAGAVIGQVGRPDRWPASRVAQEQGRSGLEYTFDRVLQGRRPGYIGVLRDPAGHVYPEQRFALSPITGADIRSTIDFAWQQSAERALKAAGVRHGAVVILDVASGQVLAMANADSSARWAIPAVKGETPGSIFKLVTAAAALESYRFTPNSRFFCSGKLEVPGIHMACWTVHGRESLVEALAQSCDTAFAQVGATLGPPGFLEMWRRLHLGTTQLQQTEGRDVLAGSEPGVLFRRADGDIGRLANSAIGQQDVRISPLQAANLARTIADGGVYQQAQLVLDAEHEGTAVRSYGISHPVRVMSRWTAATLSQAMRMAVVLPTGTAHTLANAPVTVAVKTGTAELVPATRVNGWIVGFAPVNHPQIAFSVFAGDLSGGAAHQAVTQITKSLLQAYRQFRPSVVIG